MLRNLRLPEKTEQEFVDQYEGYAAKQAARELYRAMYPTGMHTNGPLRVVVDGGYLLRLLSKWKVSDAS